MYYLRAPPVGLRHFRSPKSKGVKIPKSKVQGGQNSVVQSPTCKIGLHCKTVSIQCFTIASNRVMVYSEKWTSYTVLLVLTRPYGGAWRRSCAAASIIAVPTQFQRPLFYIAHRYSNTLQFPKNSRTVSVTFAACQVRPY